MIDLLAKIEKQIYQQYGGQWELIRKCSMVDKIQDMYEPYIHSHTMDVPMFAYLDYKKYADDYVDDEVYTRDFVDAKIKELKALCIERYGIPKNTNIGIIDTIGVLYEECKSLATGILSPMATPNESIAHGEMYGKLQKLRNLSAALWQMNNELLKQNEVVLAKLNDLKTSIKSADPTLNDVVIKDLYRQIKSVVSDAKR